MSTGKCLTPACQLVSFPKTKPCQFSSVALQLRFLQLPRSFVMLCILLFFFFWSYSLAPFHRPLRDRLYVALLSRRICKIVIRQQLKTIKKRTRMPLSPVLFRWWIVSHTKCICMMHTLMTQLGNTQHQYHSPHEATRTIHTCSRKVNANNCIHGCTRGTEKSSHTMESAFACHHPYTCVYQLTLCVLPYVGDRTFPATAASVCNSLPESVRSSLSLQVFRSRLKTELFARSYRHD